LVHVVALADELVSLDHGPHNGVPSLDLQDSLSSGVERLHVTCSEVPRESIQNLMVVEFSRELEKFRCFMRL
jgi:hypothetical protein